MLWLWTITIADHVDPAWPSLVCLRIVHALVHEIERGRLPPGAFSPGSVVPAAMPDGIRDRSRRLSPSRTKGSTAR